MAKNQDGYLSAKESRRISKENRRITDQYEKRRKRRNVPESEYTTQMKDPANAVEFDNLHTYFFTDTGVVKSVDGVSFEVPIGKTVGVVGESGCGKSVTSLSLMQLLQRPQGQIVEGAIRLNLGNDKAYDIAKTPADKMQGLRGNYISMIFQEPMTSLNPVFRIGAQIDEVIDPARGRGQDEGGHQEAHHRDARDGRHRQQRGRLRDVPPRAVRRYAPARHDRHGAGLQPEDHHCRRADHRAGRDDPGTDPRPAAQPEGPHQFVHHAHHA